MSHRGAGGAGAIIVIAGLWLGGCSTGDTDPAITTTRDSAGVAIVENDLQRLSASCVMSPEPTVSIGAAGGDEAYQLFRVFGARKLSDGRIALVNQGSQELRFYDANGKFVGRGGRAGRGPGEFENAFYHWVLPGDTIWVGDYRPWQFHIFSPDGSWKRTVRPTPQYNNSPEVMAVLNDGRSVLAERPWPQRDPNGFAMEHITVVIHGPDGALVDTIGTFPNGRVGNLGDTPVGPWAGPHFESYTRVSASGSRIIIGHGATPELSVHRVGDSTRLERIIRWTTHDRKVTPEDIAAERKRLREQYPDLDPAMYKRMVEPLVREDRPAAEVFPAFAGIISGRDGRIWVREYPTPDRPNTRSYLGFDAEGRLLCRMAMPGFDNLFEIGSDYLLALDPDSLGVERVVLHAISKPSTSLPPR